MIGKNLKKYLSCHKYYFVPLGILSIFVVIAFTACFSGITNVLKDFFNKVGEIAKNTNFDWNVIWQTLVSEISKIDYSQSFNQIVKSMTSSEWLTGLLQAVVTAVFGEGVVDQVTGLITITISQLVTWVVAGLSIVLLGLIIGFLVVKILVRKELTKVKVGKLVLFALLDSILWGLFVVLITFLFSLSLIVGLIVSIIFVLSLMFICLLEGYLFYGIKKVTFKEVMNVKSFFKLYLIGLIIVVIAASIIAILFLLFNPVIALYVAFPFLEIAIASVSLIAESHVVDLVNQKEEPLKEE